VSTKRHCRIYMIWAWRRGKGRDHTPSWETMGRTAKIIGIGWMGSVEMVRSSAARWYWYLDGRLKAASWAGCAEYSYLAAAGGPNLWLNNLN
jgi:hypothetical protein